MSYENSESIISSRDNSNSKPKFGSINGSDENQIEEGLTKIHLNVLSLDT